MAAVKLTRTPAAPARLRRFSAAAGLAALVAATLTAAAGAVPSTGLLRISGNTGANVESAEYQYVILHADRAALIPGLKAANPNVKVLVYKDMAAAVSWAGSTNLPAGVSMGEANANPEWFLKDTRGKRIEWCDYAGDWQMDVGSVSYQNRWATNVAADMRENGWDGVFVDDANASQSWHLCGRTIAKYPTDAAYAGATRSFLANVGPDLRAQGFLVLPNIYLPYGSTARATWLDWISFTSGGMQEYWSKWNTNATGHFAGADWTYRQQFLSATQNAGKIFLGLTYAPMSDVRSMRYARASFLLDWDGGPSALLFDSGNGSNPASAEWMVDVGAPRGARYPQGAAWRRDYSAGTVIVNPSPSVTAWVTLEKPYLNADGSPVTSVALPPGTGAILRHLGATVPAPPVPVSPVLVPPVPAPRTPSGPVVAPGAVISLTGVKVKRTGADLYWQGLPSGTAVDIFRNGVKIAPLPGERGFTYTSFPDRFGFTARARISWTVCVANTPTCSNAFSLTY